MKTKVWAKDEGRKIPKRFYVVMPFGDDYAEKAMKDLSSGVLHGVVGISDKAEIIMQWYGMARDAILAMDGPSLVKLNKLSRVQYENPDYMVSNGMLALYRLMDKDPTKKYGPKSLAQNIKDHVVSALKRKPLATEFQAQSALVADAVLQSSVALEKAREGLPKDPDDLKQVLREAQLSDSDLNGFDRGLRKTEEALRDFSQYIKEGRFDQRIADLYLSGDNYEHWVRFVRDDVMPKANEAIQNITDWNFGDEVVAAVAKLLDVLNQAANSLEKIAQLRERAIAALAEHEDYSQVVYKSQRGDLLKIFEEASAGFKDVQTVSGLAKLIHLHAQKDRDLKSLTREQWTKLLRKGLEDIGRTYHDEGEWLVKDRKLVIPPGSTLWITKHPLPPETEARRLRSEKRTADDFVHDWAIEANNRYDQRIKDLDLQSKYSVIRVDRNKFDQAKSKWLNRTAKEIHGSVVEAAKADDFKAKAVIDAKLQVPLRNLPAQLKLKIQAAKKVIQALDGADPVLSQFEESLDADLHLGEEERLLLSSSLTGYANTLQSMLDLSNKATSDYAAKSGDLLPSGVAKRYGGNKQFAYDFEFLKESLARSLRAVSSVVSRMEKEADLDFMVRREYLSSEAAKAYERLLGMLTGLPAKLDLADLEKQVAEAKRLSGPGDDLKPVGADDTETLYHASISATDILANGFAAEPPLDGGLGGSQSALNGKGISFTYDLHAAKEIARCLKEAVDIVQGRLRAPALLRMIEADGNADVIMRNWKNERAGSDMNDPATLFYLYGWFYLRYSKERFDPIFFGNSKRMAEALMKADPKKIGVVVATVDMTNKDISFHPGELELRVPPKAVLSVDRVIR